MIKSFQFLFLLIGVVILSSCGSSNHVVSNKLIQKRKYNAGWFVKSSARSLKNSSPSEIQKDLVEMKVRKEVENVVSDKVTIHKNTVDHSIAVHSSDLVYIPHSEGAKHSENRVSENKVDQLQAVIEAKPTEQARRKHKLVDEVESVPEEKNKVAVASFIGLIAAALFIGLGFAVMISSETFFILTFGLVLLLTSLVLAILALTKYKHLEKSKVFAKITLYTILIAPVLMLILGFIALKANSSYSF